MARKILGSTRPTDEVLREPPVNTPSASPIGAEYTAWLKSSLSNYEALAKRLVKHRPEKGRIVESVVKSALRTILPERYSIGTGFAVTASGQSSSQLDLVIYDGFSNSPLILEGGVGLFPIECVYGFIEVKSVLDPAAIDSSTKAIGTMRSFAKEKRFIAYRSRDVGNGKKVVEDYEIPKELPPRSFVFAINSTYKDIRDVEASLEEATKKNKAFIHGLAVMESDWFIAQRAYQKSRKFVHKEGQSLAAFCAAVLDSIQSVNIGPASMKRYLGLGI